MADPSETVDSEVLWSGGAEIYATAGSIPMSRPRKKSGICVHRGGELSPSLINTSLPGAAYISAAFQDRVKTITPLATYHLPPVGRRLPLREGACRSCCTRCGTSRARRAGARRVLGGKSAMAVFWS